MTEDVKAVDKENGKELTDGQAAEILAKLKSGEISEEELKAAAGGCLHSERIGLSYKGDCPECREKDWLTLHL